MKRLWNEYIKEVKEKIETIMKERHDFFKRKKKDRCVDIRYRKTQRHRQ